MMMIDGKTRIVTNVAPQPGCSEEIIRILSGLKARPGPETIIEETDAIDDGRGQRQIGSHHEATRKCTRRQDHRMIFDLDRHGQVQRIAKQYPPSDNHILAKTLKAARQRIKIVGMQNAIIIRHRNDTAAAVAQAGIARAGKAGLWLIHQIHGKWLAARPARQCRGRVVG